MNNIHNPTTHGRSMALLALAVSTAAMGGTVVRQDGDAPPDQDRLRLTTEQEAESGSRISRGTYRVFEHREAAAGRTIDLDIVILHASGPAPEPDPVFFISGGPGVNATSNARGFRDSWMREDRDIVLVSQRGTQRANSLRCSVPGTDDDLQTYLDPIFADEEAFRAALVELQGRADLTKYSTPIAADDLNEIRQALGYDKINLMGGSYGTRASLVYMRRHTETVRTAILTGIAPIAFTNPLFHAREAQAGLEMIFAECAADPECSEAFENLESEFNAVMERLETAPAEVMIAHPTTGDRVLVTITRSAFAEALRVMMYSMPMNRRVPYLIHRAFEGDYEPFAQIGLRTNRRLRQIITFGMLLCVTCSEDLDRIDPDTIPLYTDGTFLGDGRVRGQMTICEFWPRSELPENYGEPVSVDIPTLLISGTHDPVTPPRWGAEAASHLPNSLHLIVPGAHGGTGALTDSIVREFLRTGSVENLDTSSLDDATTPPFAIESELRSRVETGR